METLRRARLLTRLLLVWFGLSVGIAVASPVLKPHSTDVVCSGSGTLMLTPTDDGAAGPSGHEHDCRLCVVIGAPPVPLVIAVHEAPDETPFLHLPQPAPSQAPAPFQPRGPPLL